MFNLKAAPRAIVKAAEESATLCIRAMEGETPELMIMDDIGEDFTGGISAISVKEFLSNHKGSEVKARFNSFGGSAYEGVVMHNAFQEHGNVTAIVDGIAYSAASIAASGAKRLVMQEASDFGIHYSWTIAAGNAQNLRGAIEWLDSVDEKQIAVFMNRTGKDRETIEAWMKGTDDGTIFSANEALEAGFADEVIPLSNRSTERASKMAHGRIAAELKQKLIRSKKSLTR